MITVVAISSEKDFEGLDEWINHLPDSVNKVVVRTVKGGNNLMITQDSKLKVYEWGYTKFRFDEARNYAISKADTDWVIMLDMDERLQIFDRDIEEISNFPKSVGGGFVTLNNYTESGLSSFRLLRIVRRDAVYKYRVHEDITPWAVENKLQIVPTPVCIRHLGYNTKEVQRDHLKRNYDLLREDLMEYPYSQKVMGDMLDTLRGLNATCN